MPLISENSAGDRTLLPSPGAGRFIRVKGYVLIPNGGNVTVTWKSGSTPLSGPMPLADNFGHILPFAPQGWWDCGEDDPLVLNLGTAVQVSGFFACDIIGR